MAAQSLALGGRKVALLDIDHHHGNGNQDIFYRRSDVYTLSIHGHPNNAYPHFSGFADEKGEGDGSGFNRNYPLRPRSEEHTSELQSLMCISYAVFCLKKKKQSDTHN